MEAFWKRLGLTPLLRGLLLRPMDIPDFLFMRFSRGGAVEHRWPLAVRITDAISTARPSPAGAGRSQSHPWRTEKDGGQLTEADHSGTEFARLRADSLVDVQPEQVRVDEFDEILETGQLQVGDEYGA